MGRADFDFCLFLVVKLWAIPILLKNRIAMATIKVKLRPSIVEGKAGVIYYQITHNRKTLQITTRVRVRSSDWDAEHELILKSAPNRSMSQSRIDSDLMLLRRIISDFESSGNNYSVKAVVESFKSPQCHTLLLDYMESLIGQLRAANRFGTALNYEKTKSSFGEFLAGERLPLSAMCEQVVTDYNLFLISRGLVRNSISFYMRVLRAVYNKAVRQKLVVQSHPFVDVYMGVDSTRKRAVPESVILRLNKLQLSVSSPLSLTRDLFIFSYCTRGMAFVDMAYLRTSNLQNGTICYSRRKTGQLLIVKIEPSIQRIIDRYATANSPYVFPLLTSTEPAEAYEQYNVALNTHNRLLGRLSEMLGCGCKLTSYTSRHSWATAARNHNVPISVISQGMGHTTEHTTRIYLSMLENSVIDDANRDVICNLE